MNNRLFDFVVGFLRVCTKVFFRTIEVVGIEHVPEDGPVILVGNHPNSLLDPVLITTTCGRRVRFAAKDVLFSSWALRPALTALGAVPIKRRQDHASGPDAKPLDNAAAFSALFDILRGGHAFGIFPEGISHAMSELAPLKSGAARIALGAYAEGAKVRVVPCGLTYKKRERLRSRVLVQFGPAIEIDDAIAARFADDERAAATELTEAIDTALRSLTVNAPDFETLRVLDGVRRLYAPPGHKLSLAERAELSRRFLAHWHRLAGTPEIDAMYKDVDEYLFTLAALGLHDRDLRREVYAREWAGRVFAHLLLVFCWAPLALPGVIIHAPVLLFAVFAGEALTPRKDVRATTKLAACIVLTLGGYAVVGAGLFWVFPPVEALLALPIALTLLLASGWATIRVLERQSVLRRALRVFLLLLDLKGAVRELQDRRAALRDRVLALVDQHYRSERVIPSAAQPEA